MRTDSLEEVQRIGEDLEAYGCEGAKDKELFGWQGCVLDRLLSIYDGRAVGYRLETIWQVIHTATLEKAANKVVWHTLYLLALKAYPVQWKPQHQAHIDSWRKRVWSDLKQCAQDKRKSVYLRDRKFDPLFGFLFPELKKYLQVPLPGEPEASTASPSQPPRKAQTGAEYPTSKPRTSRGWWLKGKDLEDWRRENPEAARDWDASRRT